MLFLIDQKYYYHLRTPLPTEVHSTTQTITLPRPRKCDCLSQVHSLPGSTYWQNKPDVYQLQCSLVTIQRRQSWDR
jgi:hypothetical protein